MRAFLAKVSCQRSPATHSDGQELPLAAVSFLAVHRQGFPSAKGAMFFAAPVGIEQVGGLGNGSSPGHSGGHDDRLV